MYKTYLSHARIGILLSILNEITSYSQEVLVPDYICESVPNFLISHNIKVKFYNIDLNLKIEWEDLNSKININTKFLIIVNYFGFPQDLLESIKIAKKYNLILIEDNSHGYYGKFNNKELGTFGDYGITSPRKHLPLKFGGILYSKNYIKFKNIDSIYKSNFYDKFNYYFSSNLLHLKLKLKKRLKGEIFEIKDIYEPIIKISKLDKFSYRAIEKNNWQQTINLKNDNFKKWEKFCIQHSLKNPINFSVQGLNPWAYPVILNNQKEVIFWLNWGVNNNVLVFSWPTIFNSSEIGKSAKILSKNLVCFSTYNYINV